MTANVAKILTGLTDDASIAKKTGLALLRMPFADNQISQLPKPTKAQTEAVKANFKDGIRCKLCNAWHHPKVEHLAYVGHAALTDRLLDVDPKWTWEPLATTADGLPAFDKDGGLWIKLTILDVTRLGYGNADGKTGGNAIKEVIGDALRNGGMRFGAALDLWHKGELHRSDEDASTGPTANGQRDPNPGPSRVAGGDRVGLKPDSNGELKPAAEVDQQNTIREAGLVTDAQLGDIKRLIPLTGRTDSDLLTAYKIKSLIELTEAKASKLVAHMDGEHKAALAAKAAAAAQTVEQMLDDDVPF